MKIIIAPDSFKGNMRSATVCQIIKEALLSELPDADIQTFPMADGGEGTVNALVSATGGTLMSTKVSGPLGETVEAQYGLLPDGTAIMEMAAASGIELIPADQLNPMETTTYGTGELLKHLLQHGHSSITSGNYRNYYEEDGKKYAHTIDPKTGYPVQHSLLSATVLANNCMDADAFATAFMVLGLEKSIEIAKGIPEIKVYFIYSGADGEMHVHFSDGFKVHLAE